jgi:tetratricopeptide (TPR) repeat protein
MEMVQDALAQFAGLVFEALKALGAVLGFLAALVLIFGILRSILSVTLGRATLILPFRGEEQIQLGKESGLSVSALLAQQLEEVESTWRDLARSIRAELVADVYDSSMELVDIGDCRFTEEAGKGTGGIVVPDPTEGEPLGTISFGAATFSPQSIIATLDLARSKLARRTIRGDVEQFGETLRLSATYNTWGKHQTQTVISRRVEDYHQFVDLLNDVAFQIAKQRLVFHSDAQTWHGYRFFLRAYIHQVRYIRTGKTPERDDAITSYKEAVKYESDFHLAMYNLGNLLYNRYTAADNAEAIEHLRQASLTPHRLLKALALSVYARACCQQIHRYGKGGEPWLHLALVAISEAKHLQPNLDEAWLSQGFALQFKGEFQQALDSYRRAISLASNPVRDRLLKSMASKKVGDHLLKPVAFNNVGNRLVKSMASNNMGYIYLVHLNNPAEAEEHLRLALQFNPQNKFSHANLAELFKRCKDYDRALKHLQVALEQDPSYVNGHNELAMLYLVMTREALDAGRSKEEAELLAQKAREAHQHALVLVPEGQAEHRAEITHRFRRAAQGEGIGDEVLVLV